MEWEVEIVIEEDSGGRTVATEGVCKGGREIGRGRLYKRL